MAGESILFHIEIYSAERLGGLGDKISTRLNQTPNSTSLLQY